MAARITTVAIPSNAAWKITNDASKQALEEAAVRVVLDGGDPVPGSESRPLRGNQIIINLRTEKEIRGGLPALLAPTVMFGDLCVVDRDEIEGFRSVYQLLKDYKENEKKRDSRRPISLAVFGPPGSGKSFGVKEVAKAVIGESVREPIVFNLAQFSHPDQLASAFLKIQNSSSGGVPLVFFDEFDSSLAGDDLGWLRYFLAPMEDGEFFYNNEYRHIGRAILVFAGGTSASLRGFSREEGSTEQDRYQFVQAKGPDFISRLSGNINILGVNRREDAPDQSYVLRRAVVIRNHLKFMDLIGRTGRSLVDSGFLKKLLNVGRYKHGARSVKTVLTMCLGKDGVVHLPPPDQLMMHVDKSDADGLLS